MTTFAAAVGLGPEKILQDLLELSPDPFFPEKDQGKKLGFLKLNDPSKSNVVLEKLTRMNLDLTRISNRVLVMGRCWAYRTDREAHRNNLDEIACFLNARYERSYLIFNFASPDMKYDVAPFRNQVVNFPVSKMLALTVKILFNACRAITAWLRLSPENVVVIQCKNGKSRSGLVVACLLRVCGLFDSAHESLEYFRKRRCPEDDAWISVTLKRYLRYFNDILILEGRVPSSVPLKLHQVILTTIPNFDGAGGCAPGIEIFQEGRLIYSSAVRMAEIGTGATVGSDDDMDEELLKEFRISLVLNPGKLDKMYNPLVMMDEYNVIFKLEEMSVERDVQVRVYHHNAQAGQNVTIFSLAFNTGFMTPGIIRLKASDLELDPKRFDPGFSVDLVITPDETSGSSVTYESSVQRSFIKDLMKLSQFHPVRFDPLLAKPLELQGHRKFFVKLSLQLGNNDIHAAHEFLSFLAKSSHYSDLDRQLSALSREKYEQSGLASKAIEEKIEFVDKELVIETVEGKVNPILEAVNKGELKAPSTERPAGLPFLAGLLKATESRKETGILSDAKEEEVVQVVSMPSSPPPARGPPFMASLLKATAQRRNNGSLEDAEVKSSSSSSVDSRTSSPVGGPPFLAGLLKATACRKNIGALDDSPIKEPAVLASPLMEPARINPNPPPAPPLPVYLRHAKKPSIPEAPPLPDYLRYPKSASIESLVPSVEVSMGSLSLSSNSLPFTGGLPPPPFPPSFLRSVSSPSMAPPLPTPPPFPQTHSTSNLESKHKIKNTLHWDEIRGEDNIRNTVWSELKETGAVDELDVLKFEELFCVDPLSEGTRVKKSQESIEAPKNAPRILDSRRANNVGIGLSRFYKRMTNTEIVNAVVYQKDLLDMNDLMCLKAILPTEDEGQQLALFNGDPKVLVPSEQFMLEMTRHPNIAWMIDALIFEGQFSNEFESLSLKLVTMTSSLIKIRESPDLKMLFRLVLELGNLAKYDYGRVPAHMRIRGKALGFTMDSLLKLHEVKSVDRKSSLLNYLVMVIQDKHTSLISLPEDFADFATVKHWDSSVLTGEVDTLQTSLNKMVNLKVREGSPDSALVDSFRETQAPFLQLAKLKLDKLAKLSANLKRAWEETASYLGEDPVDKRPEELLIVFDQFFRQFKEALGQNKQAAAKLSRSQSNVSLKVRPSSSSLSISTRSPSPSDSIELGNSSVDTP